MVLYHLKGIKPEDIEKKSITLTSSVLDIKEFEERQKVWEQFSGKSYYLVPEIVKVNISYDDEAQMISYFISEKSVLDSEKEEFEFYKMLAEDDTTLFIDVANPLHTYKIVKEWILKQQKKFERKPLTEDRLKVFAWHITKYLTYKRLTPLFLDENIEDIHCKQDSHVYVNYKLYGWLKTNIYYTEEELDEDIKLFVQFARQEVSLTKPKASGILPEGSRLEAIYHFGESSMVIRKFAKRSLSLIDLMNFGTITPYIGAYLWLVVENPGVCKLMVSGGTATGKTTLLNALIQLIPNYYKIITIEETVPELRLPLHELHTSIVTDSEIPERHPFVALVSSLRQRPDYIILGEARGKEAEVLFQAMNSGHGGLATFHAENWKEMIDRLTSHNIGLDKRVTATLNVAIFLKRIKKGEKFVRRIGQITEVVSYNEKEDFIETIDSFVYQPRFDNYKINTLLALKKISYETGQSMEELIKELRVRAFILSQMQKQGINDFEDVTFLANLYYFKPKILVDNIYNLQILVKNKELLKKKLKEENKNNN
ncbi:MAG: type II/IV secretion system ATPase subunit [Nanoarchaeota archaeon]